MPNTMTLDSFSSPQEASIVKGMLESNGIPAFISDHNNLYVPIFGGVDILVFENDYQKAKELLKLHHDEE